MLRVTGPVTRSPSACRGDATNWIPKRPRSKTTVLRTLTSASHPLHPPALTCRSFNERPRMRCRSAARRWASLRVSPLVNTKSLRSLVASRYSRVKWSAPSGHAIAHSGQKRHRPRSIRNEPLMAIASVGQASAQASHPAGHRDRSMAGRPRNRSGRFGSVSGNGNVRLPCRSRVISKFATRIPHRSWPQ